jgi:hypothetical protein
MYFNAQGLKAKTCRGMNRKKANAKAKPRFQPPESVLKLYFTEGSELLWSLDVFYVVLFRVSLK